MAQEIADSKLIDTWSSSGLIVKPDISKIIEGWQLGEQPPHEYMNWLQNTFGSKLNHILKNGVASWNNETEYLAGATVQHTGNIWLCKTTNANSEPTDANANWKRIITVESLTTVLGGYVALSQFTGTNQSLSSNGYQKLPGGLIIQWGRVADILAENNKTFTLPVAFPTSCLASLATIESPIVSLHGNYSVYTQHNNTSVTVFLDVNVSQGVSSQNAWVFTIGH